MWRLAQGWYGSDERLAAWGLTGATLALKLLQIGIALRINLWHRDAFNALEQRQGDALAGQAWVFLLLAGASVMTAVAQLYARQMLALRWRAWLVNRLQDRWLAGDGHWHLGMLPDGADNPDQRISENTRWATFMAADLVLGLVQSVLLFVSFAGILWSLSGPLSLPFVAAPVDLPGGLVLAAVVYAGVGSFLTWIVGRPLVGNHIRRNEAESDHRFALLRVRESGEAVAMMGGGAAEAVVLRRSFAHLLGVMGDLLRRERHLMWLGSGYGMVASALPLLLLGPGFVAGTVSLGVLMQATQAFGEVVHALSWLQEAWPRIADWRGHAERVVALEDSLDAADAVRAASGIVLIEGADAAGREVLAFAGLRLASPAGGVLVREASAEIRAGERVLIRGESGAGKSTLLRAALGLWPWGEGAIRTPERDAMLVLPQRPYLPLGTLAAALTYPGEPGRFTTPAMQAALVRCGLGALAGRLAEAARWDRVLSLGEQQRLGFARLVLHRPRWVLMDEATSALDEAAQAAMLFLVAEVLPGSAVVSVGHRPGLEAWHDRVLVMVRGAEGARLEAAGIAASNVAPQVPARKTSAQAHPVHHGKAISRVYPIKGN